MAETVYISSTFNDLKNFRQAVINCIISLGDYYKPLSMEFYDAESVHFVKKCQDDVEKCGIYILILGKRYGYKPKGFAKSITELEYEKAIECTRNGMIKEILVFKTGELCKSYEYKENDPDYVEYQQSFIEAVSETLSPRPFDSEAELCLQVSLSLMKRLYTLVRAGEKIIPPDKDSVLCYCDRAPVIDRMKIKVLKEQKRLFFLRGDRRADCPGGVIRRFGKYNMGSVNKLSEPFIKITDLFQSNDSKDYLYAFNNILEYLNRPDSINNAHVEGFLNDLARIKSNKILLPFYYDFEFEEDTEKFSQFISFAEHLFMEYKKASFDYQLYFVINIYSDQPDNNTIKTYLEKSEYIKSLSDVIDKLRPVSDNDITDWLEKYITSQNFSSALYDEYFTEKEKNLYNMQEVNLKLKQIIDDLGNGSEKIKRYL